MPARIIGIGTTLGTKQNFADGCAPVGTGDSRRHACPQQIAVRGQGDHLLQRGRCAAEIDARPVEGEALQARLSTRGARPESRSGCHSHADCQSRVRKKQRITTAAQPPAALRVLMARTCL